MLTRHSEMSGHASEDDCGVAIFIRTFATANRVLKNEKLNIISISISSARCCLLQILPRDRRKSQPPFFAMVMTTRSLDRLTSVSSQTVVAAPRVNPVSTDLHARRPKKVFSLASNTCVIPRQCLTAVARNGGPEFSSLVPCLTPAQLLPSPVQHVVPSTNCTVSAGRTPGAVDSCVATGVSASLTSCGNSCSALREQLQASAALCESQRLQIDGLAADLQRLQLQGRASENIRAPTVTPLLSHTCKTVVHGFSQGTCSKHAYTAQFTEFVQNTLRI